MVFTVGILGMGRIACGFDAPQGAAITSHVKAILAEPRLRLVAVADVDEARAKAEAARFSLAADVLLPETLLARKLDALVIATPDGTHADYARRAAHARLVVVEKPLEGDAMARRTVVAEVEARDGTVVINHLRRWIPGLNGWMAAAQAGDFGAPVSVSAHVSRGYRHNGIHAADLIAGFLAPRVVMARQVGQSIADFSAEDATRTILAELASAFGAVPVLFVGVDGRVQTAFSVDIRFEKARVVIEDEDGVQARLYRPHPVGAAGFADELRLAESYIDNPPRLMAEVWRNIADHLDNGAPLASSGMASLAGYGLLDALEGAMA